MQGHAGCVSLLLDHGANVDQCLTDDANAGTTALMAAAVQGTDTQNYVLAMSQLCPGMFPRSRSVSSLPRSFSRYPPPLPAFILKYFSLPLLFPCFSIVLSSPSLILFPGVHRCNP